MTDSHDQHAPTPEPERTVMMGSPSSQGAAPAVDAASLQRLLPELEIVEQIGSGGMGAVFRARHRELDRPLALKIIRADAAADTQFEDRFAREARALAKLSHPHIVAVHDFGRREGLCYLTMELVDGVNLRELMRERALPLERIAELVPELCDALQYAHDHGVIHRDVKPENILIDRRGRARLVDFGLAKLTHDHSSGAITSAQQVFGTPRYMAPEQLESAAAVDHRADIYSLGVVLYELLTGQLPLGKFASPSRVRPVDARLDAVILRALERDPAERFQQVRELKQAWIAATDPSGMRRLGWPPIAVIAMLIAGCAQFVASARLLPLVTNILATNSRSIVGSLLLALWCFGGLAAGCIAIGGAIRSWKGSPSRWAAWGAAALCVPATWACLWGIPAAWLVRSWRRRIPPDESARTDESQLGLARRVASYVVCAACAMGIWLMVWGLAQYFERSLLTAAREGDTSAVAAALWWGVGLERRNIEGETPLVVAAWHRRSSFVDAVLAAGAEVDAETLRGETALMKGAFLGDEAVVQAILRRHPELNLRDSAGETAILKAAARGNLPVVVALQNRGASLTECDAQGMTPLLWAALGGHLEVARFLANHADVATRSYDGETLLHKAALRGHAEFVPFGLERGLDINAQDRAGETPLAQAAYLGRLDMVRVLLQRGADVELATNKGITPLAAAASQGHAEVVRTLRDRGANAQRKIDQRRTALHVAVESDQTDCAEALAERWDAPPSFFLAWRGLHLARSEKLDEARQSLERALAEPIGEDDAPWLLGSAGWRVQIAQPETFGWLLVADQQRRLGNSTLVPPAIEKARAAAKWTGQGTNANLVLCQRKRRTANESRDEEFVVTRESLETFANDSTRPLAIRVVYREEVQQGSRFDRREGTRAGSLEEL